MSRHPHHFLAVAVPVAAVALAIVAVGCGGGSRPGHTSQIEPQIAAKIEKDTGVKIKSVDCPEHTSTALGSTYQCTATTEQGLPYTVTMKTTRVVGDQPYDSLVKVTKGQ